MTLSTGSGSALSAPAGGPDTVGMDVDPYERLAGLMWLLRPCDVGILADVADLLADRHIEVTFGPEVRR